MISISASRSTWATCAAFWLSITFCVWWSACSTRPWSSQTSALALAETDSTPASKAEARGDLLVIPEGDWILVESSDELPEWCSFACFFWGVSSSVPSGWTGDSNDELDPGCCRRCVSASTSIAGGGRSRLSERRGWKALGGPFGARPDDRLAALSLRSR